MRIVRLKPVQESVSDIKEWLELNGLEDYEELFRRHKIELDILPSISEADLKEIAIPLGDRKKILKAITAYVRWNETDRNEINSNLQPADSERRQLVVLFCDLVGSTQYATSLDPEDLAGLFNTYRSTVKSIIKKHRGLTLIYEGDGIKAYFGHKIASEDEQEQTLIAALEIIDTISELNLEYAEELNVRIGIATGPVLIGDFDSPTGPHAYGQPMHLAARLETIAQPGSILVDPATYSSMQTIFDFEDSGKHEIKGYPKKVRGWRLLGRKKIGSRFAKRYRNTRMIGRQQEFDLLSHEWDSVRRQNCGSAVIVSGEAGIGKSRLVHEIRQMIKLQHSRSILIQCSPYHTDSVYYPVIETVSSELGLGEKISKHEKHQRLVNLLSQCQVPLDQSLPIFANLFSLDTAGDYGESDLSETRQQDISEEVLAAYLLEQAETRPLFVLIEDIQWIDSTSRAFFENLLQRYSDHPLFIVFTSRESEVFDSGSTQVRQIELQRLTTDESRLLMQELFSTDPVPEEFQAFIERKAEGVPLFIEELSTTILDTGLKDRQSEQITEGNEDISMSGILQSSLLSKLDRLGESKEIALLAATIGREFDFEVLSRIVPAAPAKLRKSIDLLKDAEIIFETGPSASQSYYFKHALIQDTARNLLSRKRKASTHRKIAEVLRQGTRKNPNAEPELIAHHLSMGEDFGNAAEYWLTAGKKTARTWAKKEALQLLQKGIEALFKTPESISRLRSELEFQLEIGDIMYANYGYISEQGNQAYQRALELSEQLHDIQAPVRALDGLFGMHFNSCHFDETIRISDRLIELGESYDNIAALVLGMQFKGMSQFCRGEFLAASDYLSNALAHINRSDEVGSDFPSMALIYLSWAQYIRNQPEASIKSYSEALAIVQVQAPYRKAACLGDGCILYAFMNEPGKVRELSDELIPLAERYGFNLWLNIAKFFRGWSDAQEKDPSGLAEMENMMHSLGGQEIDKTMFLCLLASTCIAFEKFDAGFEAAKAGLSQVKQTGERYMEAELLRIRANLASKFGANADEVRAWLTRAIDCAQQQSATRWQEKAVKDLDAFNQTESFQIH